MENALLKENLSGTQLCLRIKILLRAAATLMKLLIYSQYLDDKSTCLNATGLLSYRQAVSWPHWIDLQNVRWRNSWLFQWILHDDPACQPSPASSWCCPEQDELLHQIEMILYDDVLTHRCCSLAWVFFINNNSTTMDCFCGSTTLPFIWNPFMRPAVLNSENWWFVKKWWISEGY